MLRLFGCTYMEGRQSKNFTDVDVKGRTRMIFCPATDTTSHEGANFDFFRIASVRH